MESSKYYCVAAAFFDGVYHAKGYTKDIDYYVELAKSAGGDVLEMGCGTGRVLLPIAQAGLRIHGVDSSREMLDVCEASRLANNSDVQDRVSLTLSDIATVDAGRTFDLIILPFKVFQEQRSAEAQRAVLRNVRRHLADGGLACLDAFQPNYRYIAADSEERLDAKYSDRRHRCEVSRFARTVSRPTEQILELHHRWEVYSQSGELLEECASTLDLRWFTRSEIELLLELEGFEPVGYFGGFRGEAYGPDAKEQVVQFRPRQWVPTGQ